jgi:hypothetical protein
MLLLLLVLSCATARADHTDLRRPRPNRRMIIAGSILLGIGYLVALGMAIRYEEGELATPMLGPLVDLRRCRGCERSPVGQGEIGGLLLDSMLQAAGGTLLTVGLTPRRTATPVVTLGPGAALVVF